MARRQDARERPAVSAISEFREAYSALLLAAERLRAEIEPTATDKIPRDIRRIQALVASHFGVPLPRLLSRCRDDDTACARHVAMALCRELTSHNLVAIGQAFSRDHGSVVHGIRSLTARCEQNEQFASTVNQLRQTARHAATEA